jgi:hypothetical protein
MENKKEGLSKKTILKLIHKEASKFRKGKIKEVFSKKNPTEEEICLVNRWAEMFGVNI